jgi:hypothetical protein
MMAVITHNKSSLKPKTAPKFLRSLYDMLHFEDPDILAWSHDGAFFQVFDVRRLEQEVLAKYFKHNKFTSLQRQLNNFGFRKWTKTRANVCTFSHDVLRRCHPDELSEMVHNSEKTMAARASHFQSVSAKRARPDNEEQIDHLLVTGAGLKRLCVEKHLAEIASDDNDEPEAAPPCMEALGTPHFPLDGFEATDLYTLDWSLVTDQTREDDLLALIDPMMVDQPPAPIISANESQYDLSQASMFSTDIEHLPEPRWWMDFLDNC